MSTRTKQSNVHTARLLRASILLACAAALSTSAGCSWWRSMTGQTEVAPADDVTATSRPATTQLTSEDVRPVAPQLEIANRPVVQGALPLFYLVETDGVLRVRNVESKEEIITFPAKAMQIVRVESAGVMLANEPVIGATLAPGTYAIEIVPPNANSIRSTQKREGIPTRPDGASQSQ